MAVIGRGWRGEGGARWRRRLRWVGLVVLVVAFFAAIGERGLFRLYRLTRTRAELAQEITRLKASNGRLAEEAHALREDPSRIEAIAREDLGLVRPGDVVYEFLEAREEGRNGRPDAPRRRP